MSFEPGPAGFKIEKMSRQNIKKRQEKDRYSRLRRKKQLPLIIVHTCMSRLMTYVILHTCMSRSDVTSNYRHQDARHFKRILGRGSPSPSSDPSKFYLAIRSWFGLHARESGFVTLNGIICLCSLK